MEKGISVVICCYNSCWIIARCLDALLRQRVGKDVKWEIVLVDNLCTDTTVDIALDILSRGAVDYSIIEEDTPGLLNARVAGVKKAKYSYIIFCDDDNLLSDNYVDGMFRIMEANPEVGACGGRGIAEFQAEPHPMVVECIGNYAIGSQKGSTMSLFGAGLCVRRDVTLRLYIQGGFILTGRCGDVLLAGDDGELVKRIILCGYKITSTDELTFIHVLAARRLTLDYLLKMQEGFGVSNVVLYVYDTAILGRSCIFLYVNKVEYYLRLIKNILFGGKKRYVNINCSRGVIKGYRFWGMKRLNDLLKMLEKEKHGCNCY